MAKKFTRPFLKWAGNKYTLLNSIFELLPEGNRIVEPFAGSGVVFINASHERALICDSNPDLINLYKSLKRNHEGFIEDSCTYFKEKYNKEKAYYKLREEFNSTADNYLKAILFLYLNRHGYNGLCRYNMKGIFNVPFGRYKKPYFPYNELIQAYQRLKKSKIIEGDYKKAFYELKEGDVVYCDPPYSPLSQTANFTQYSGVTFKEQDQLDLAELALSTASKGIPVLVSNHDTPFTRQAFGLGNMKYLLARRNISCKSDSRSPAKEMLALYSA